MSKLTVEDRLWAKVDRSAGPDDCWLWTAAKTRHGYGRLRVSGRVVEAHRLAYEFLVGTIPSGLELDHLCRNPGCVNPAHLEPVTHRVNMLRGQTIGAVNAAKIYCANGHEFTLENTYIYKGCRECRACRRRRLRDWYAANRSQINARRRAEYRAP